MSGHDLRKTLVGKLDDPDAYGAGAGGRVRREL